MMKMSHFGTVVAAFAALGMAAPAESQAPAAAASGLSYADLADRALTAPIVAHVRVARSARLKPEEAPGLASGRTRFYVEADIVSLIRSPAGLSSRVAYLADLPNEGGKPPRLRKASEHLVFAAPVPGSANEIRLTAPDAQLAYVPANAERLRAILGEAAAPGAPPQIVGIGRAFHVPGSLPGESETQIFLQTADNRPVSLSVLRRPGQAPQWLVSLTEIVDNSAAAPARDTLLWYRLACSLPRSLPRPAVSEAGPEEAQAIAADYRLVLEGLGPCARSAARS